MFPGYKRTYEFRLISINLFSKNYLEIHLPYYVHNVLLPIMLIFSLAEVNLKIFEVLFLPFLGMKISENISEISSFFQITLFFRNFSNFCLICESFKLLYDIYCISKNLPSVIFMSIVYVFMLLLT
jgi:hypothetical protein